MDGIGLEEVRQSIARFANRMSADNTDKNVTTRMNAGLKRGDGAGIIRKLRISPQSERHQAGANLLVNDVKAVGLKNRRAFRVRSLAHAFRASVERESADEREGGADPFKDFGFSAFRIAFDEIDAGETMLARESLDCDGALFDTRAVGEDRRIRALGEKAELDLAVFPPNDVVKGAGICERGDIFLKAGEYAGVWLETECTSPIACADMSELSSIGADVEDDVFGAERNMTADAVFAFEAVKPRRPSLAVELPSKRRGDRNALVLNPHEEPVRRFLKTHIDIPTQAKCRERALAEKFEALTEGELQEISRKRRKPAIMRARPPVTPREGARK